MKSINKKLISGKRKEAIASVQLFEGKGKILVNNKAIESYFPTKSLIIDIYKPFIVTNMINKYDVVAKIKGGGFSGQANALRLAIAKSLLGVDEEFRKVLKQNELLTRDSRIKERKKYGLKKAIRAPQFSKR